MTTLHKGEPPNWVERFKNGSLHLVCVASGGLTACDFAASTIGVMRQQEEVWPLTYRVNEMGETGTFWPRLSLTVVPQMAWETRKKPEDLENFFRTCFLDVAKANRLYVKQADVFVDLNSGGGYFDTRIALPIAREILMNESSIKNLWFIPES